jgi:hypothetical protein
LSFNTEVDMRSRLILVIAAVGLGFAASQADANLLINGGFETGDFSGWTRGSDTSLSGVVGSPTATPHSGSFVAEFGERSPGSLSQTIATTPGTTYVVDLFLGRGPLIASGSVIFFQGSFAGTSFIDATAATLPLNSPYIEYTGSIVATSATSSLVFNFEDQPSYIYLDDVSVTGPATPPVPEPEIYPLLLVGFAAMGAISRRRKKQG